MSTHNRRGWRGRLRRRWRSSSWRGVSCRSLGRVPRRPLLWNINFSVSPFILAFLHNDLDYLTCRHFITSYFLLLYLPYSTIFYLSTYYVIGRYV
jgi:hypothetical protein